MGILKKRKKEKLKKAWNIDRFTAILMPILLIVIVVISCLEFYRSCDIPIDDYSKIAKELSIDYDVNNMLTSNKILDSDYTTMKEKLGSSGVDMPIFIDGEIIPSLYDGSLFVEVLNNFSLTDCEMGAFCSTILSVFSDLKIDILELTLSQLSSGDYVLTSVYSFDISQLTKDSKTDVLKGIKTIYVKSVANVEMTGDIVVIKNVSSQINRLEDKLNKQALELLNTLCGYKYDACSELAINIVNDLTTKTNTKLNIQNHVFEYNLEEN